MKKILIVLLFVLTLVGCSSASVQTPQVITATEGKKMLDQDSKIILVDVRTLSEYQSGHINGAILLPLDVISSQAEVLLSDKNATIIVYCRSGNRSAQAVQILYDMGYTKLFDMGGIIDWPYDIVS